MSIPGAVNPLLLGGGDQEYQIERSLRFNSSDSAYLSRTPASAGNRKTWTWSGWIKLTSLDAAATSVFQARISDTQLTGISLSTSGTIFFQHFYAPTSYNNTWTTNAVYRDFSAWYHLVVSCDFTEASSANALRIYVNGTEQALTFSTNGGAAYAQNTDTFVNSTVQHSIGLRVGTSYLNGYLADVHFIDGQALDPTSFAETNATTGQWVPIEYTGTYGTNGFHLPLSDNSAATATTLGKDTSGNGNNWTPNNLSVTAGAGNDSLVDTPTSYGTDTGAGGEVRGNYCTLNPLDLLAQTLDNGNLQISGSTSGACVTGTVGVSTGKWYWEITAGSAEDAFGIWSVGSRVTIYPGGTSDSYCYYGTTGEKYNNNAGSSYGSTFTAGDVIGIALDLNAGTLTFYKNNVSQGVAFSGLTGGYRPAVRAGSSLGASTATYANFGQRPFAYTAPSGFKALCDTNLPTPLVAKPNAAFDVALWTGNGSARSITGLNFNPDLVWIKGRSGATDHALYDVVRGAEKRLESNTTDAEVTSDGGVTAFNSDGFSLGTLAQVNTNSATYVGWAWDGGSSTATNTQGSITSQVRANASAGFSIVTYTGTGASASVGHGLGVAPRLFIIKSRDSGAGTNQWIVYTTVIDGSLDYLFLDSTSAKGDAGESAPTSSVFNLDTAQENNKLNNRFVAYCFAPVAGYSSFGSYTGNGSTDGPFVYTGFRPKWFLVKRTDSANAWVLFDSVRGTFNLNTPHLQPHLSDAEANVSTYGVDFLSNGIKPRATDTSLNSSGGTYIYAAFAENPFQYARAR